MIKYNLTCKCGKAFESWFSSSYEFDSLNRKKLIKCIYCDSSSIKKSVMAPNLSSKSNKILTKTNKDDSWSAMMEGKACEQWKKELDNGLKHYIGITLGQIQKE